jgi:hypothetical protein
MAYITTEVEVDVDIDDILYELSTDEKLELCEHLIEDGYGPEGENQMVAETYTEQQLIGLINQIWGSKMFIDQKVIDELTAYLKDKNIL